MSARLSPAALVAPVLLLAGLSAAPPAHAGDVLLRKVTVTHSRRGDTVVVQGSVTAPADVPVPVTVRLRLGTFEQTLAPPNLVRRGRTLVWRAPRRPNTGVRTFSLSLRNGTFSLTAQRVAAGPFADPVEIAMDVGAQRLRALAPMTASRRGTVGTWKRGMPLRARVEGRVLQVGHVAGNATLAPVPTATFAPASPGAPAPVTVVSGERRTDADGNFQVVVEYTDPTAMGRVDIGNLLGETDGYTRPATVRPTAGDDGLEVVCLIQEESGAGGPVTPETPATFDVPGGKGAPSGTLEVPAGAVPAGTTKSKAGPRAAVAAVPTLTFTPYAMPAEFPAPLPDGFLALAGAEVTSTEPVTFDAAHRPTVELSRPPWTEAAPLAGATIRLLQYVGGQWVQQSGRGFYDAAEDRFGPDPFDPAGLSQAAPVAYAAVVAPGASAPVGGQVVDEDGAPVAGAVVLTRNGAAVTDEDGTFAVPPTTLTDDGLEVVQVVGDVASSALVVTGGEAAAGDVTVESPDTAPPAWTVGVVRGSVTDAGTGQPVAGAVVTLALGGTVRSLSHDDGGTPGNFADDTFSVPNLAVLGVLSHEWSLFVPGSPDPFVSALYTRNTVLPTSLMLEAQAAGRTISDGAYTVRVRYTIPNLGPRELFGGFRVTTVDLAVEVSDIQLPAGYEGTPAVTATTDAQGLYSSFYRAPAGIPMTAQGAAPGGSVTNTRSFVFGALATVDLEIEGPRAPDTIPVGWSVIATVAPEQRNYASVVPLGGLLYSFGHNLNRSVYRYDPAANAWATLDLLPTLHQSGRGVAAGGRVWAVGGRDSARLEPYDPLTTDWSTAPASMTYAREEGGAAVVNGKILAIGGCREHWENVQYDSSLAISHVEQYDPVTNAWSDLAPFPTGIVFPRAAVVDGVVYVVGGWHVDSASYSGEVFAYSALTDTWSPRTAMPVVRYRGACAAMNGQVYYVGGFAPGPTRSSDMYVYDPATDSWRRGPSMPDTRIYHACAATGGVLYVVGGLDNGTNLSVWAYRPE